jgi:hypothetical protein
VDLVTEELRGNVEDLKRCALVCRAWLRPSRAKLLRNPTFHNSSHYDGLCALLDADPTLETAVRTIVTWVSTPVLPELAPQLPNLTKLSLGMLSWSHADVEAHRSLRLPASLVGLSLNSCIFTSCTAFAALLASVPALRSLECDWLTCNFSEEDAAASEDLYASPVVLAELTVRELHSDMPHAAVLALGRLLRPRKLTLDLRHPTPDVRFPETLCEHSGAFLTDLHVTLLLYGKLPAHFRESSFERREKVAC